MKDFYPDETKSFDNLPNNSPLQFLSYGGSSLIGSSIIAGIILNFTRKDAARCSEND